MEWRLQSPKIEIIEDLENIIHKQLLQFIRKTSTIPKKIIYFRDGVSEPQFLKLLEYEFISIRRACLRLYINYKPSITILVVQKEHQERMFTHHTSVCNEDFINSFATGTQITYPTALVFDLCSHYDIEVGYYLL